MDYQEIYAKCKLSSIYGRYITLDHIVPILERWNNNNQLKIEGYSVLNAPIYSYTIGDGKLKIFLWSQMHGNESTTTKALMDFLNFLQTKSPLAIKLLANFTFFCLPIVNPDGAQVYTRVNANEIDLNRDAQGLSQPESKVLRKCFEYFKPDFCYNLHDQRTIFGVEHTINPATVSFLAPASDEERSINFVRRKAMSVIAAMNKTLQDFIPNQVGRFDDSFNINCIGDTFQSLGVPTILFEAGHYQNDYEREETRKFIFFALLAGFQFIYENDIVDKENDDYINIPQNKVQFYDIVYKNVKINYDTNKIITNFAIQFKEELFNNQLFFNAFIVDIGALENYFGHKTYDVDGAVYSDNDDNVPKLNQVANFYLNDSIRVENGEIVS